MRGPPTPLQSSLLTVLGMAIGAAATTLGVYAGPILRWISGM